MHLLLLLACSSSPSDSGASDGGGSAGSFPTDSSAEGIAAFVASNVWRDDPWIAESETPRDETSINSPHDRVQVFFNDVLQASSAAGNGAFQGEAHDVGSMAVKVLVEEEDDSVLGHAAMLKLEGDAKEWVYWCEGPAARCGESDDQTWAIGTFESECGGCHNGSVFNLQ